MTTPFKLTRVNSLKTPADFRAHCAGIGADIPVADALRTGAESPLLRRLAGVTINGRTPGNRIAIHPMEGWDGTAAGGVTDEMRRRWRRFGASGAKIVCGAEAMAVRPDGRANPNQLIITPENLAGIAELVRILRAEHAARWGSDDDLVVGFQLTHSGRFCRPNDKKRWESRVAFRHPVLDGKFNVTSDAQVLTDDDVRRLIADYVRAARLAREAGADFVDIKHCHGYLLHEFLGAHTRPGPYGGSFENRTRILREIVAGIRAEGNPIDLAVRLSLYDMVPHRPDPALSAPGKPGPGIPEEHAHLLPYRYAFGCDPADPTRVDLAETFRFLELLGELGFKLLNTTAGSPYYNPHLQRPAAYPPSDGYQPAHDPLVEVAMQVAAVRALKARMPAGMAVISSGLSYLQEHLPAVSQELLDRGWTDAIGVGRAVLSYPEMLADAAHKGALETRLICRTFSDCTTAPRNGLVSGCYPLDKFYTARPEFQRLKEIKRGG